MNCQKARELFAGHADGLLSEKEKQALEGHLRSCQRCSRELDAQLSARLLARSAPRFHAPEGFTLRVMKEIRAIECEPGLLSWLWSMPAHLKLLEAAALAAVVFMGVYSAGFLSDRIMGRSPLAENGDASLVASVSMEYLDPVPPESMADMYLSVKENGNEN